MNKYINIIKEKYINIPDLKIKEIRITKNNIIYIIFIETICSSDKINDYILKNLSNYNKKTDLNSNLPAGNTIKIEDSNKIEYYLNNGYAIIIDKLLIYAVEIKGNIDRSITSGIREPSLLGPEDSLIENYQTNIGLIRKRIKSNNLKIFETTIGINTNTKVGLLYLDNLINNKDLENVKNKLLNINKDIIDIGNIINNMDDNKSIFPTIKRTEKPDLIAKSLLEGKFVIVADNSPFGIILPSYFIDFINPVSDDYIKPKNATFIKILRLISFFISILAPAIFIAIINYNAETLPTSLLINFIKQRNEVPFPSIVEMIIMLFICDILRESDLRFPSSFGSTISILGALILGEAAVNAGIVSPVMIIIVSLTFICGLIFTDLEINNAIRHYRYLLLLFASFLGLYGIFLGIIIFLIKLLSANSLNYSYFFPISPFNKNKFYKSVIYNEEGSE